MVHELGHVIGLAHSESGLDSVMVNGVSTGPYGGRDAAGNLASTEINAPLGDDCAFGYDVFKSGNTSTDVAVNAWRRTGVNGPMALASAPTIINVCDGTNFNANYDWHNRGTGQVNNTSISVVMSTNDIISRTDRVVLTHTTSGGRGASQTFNATFAIPEDLGTAAGVWFRVGVVADPNLSIAEWNEFNNATRLPILLLVFDC